MARDTVRAFVAAAVTALPSGKQNSFAAQVRPEFVMSVVRHDGMALSLVNAFAAPVRPNGQSLAYHGVEALNREWINMESMYAGLVEEKAAPDVFVVTPHTAALARPSAGEREDVHLYSVASRVVTSVRALMNSIYLVIHRAAAAG